MTEIQQLSELIDSMKTQLYQVREEELIPLSFFSRSYDTLKKMNHILHVLEEAQIEKMERQFQKHKEMMAAEVFSPENNENQADELVSGPEEELLPFLIDEPVSDPEPVIEPESIIEPERIIQAEQTIQPEPIIEPDPLVESEPTIEPEIKKMIEDPKQPEKIFFHEALERKLVTDLRKAISLNERFRFQRELFGGSFESLDKALNDLNQLPNIEEAMLYIGNNFQWNFKSDVAVEFISLVKKRFE